MPVYSDAYVAWIEAEARAVSAHWALCRRTGSAAEFQAELANVSALRDESNARFGAMMSEHDERVAALCPYWESSFGA
ncbi:hypothetical protein M2282_005202 [Variovorax boronicumulans]|uniref:hypothetical protein n=1 Tax=Variovorax boronicumulans TaxID=436515 RepID=UPI00247308B5|nr:hypothetical protein [Variovorax boronicumulans]MDH6170032.1 hypothetical protein [Variovorax boronicumulans]